ncbi:hypothetical protein HKX48_005873 [Thoreauomyces humboldtii]|nr:hypothetical protein HKX48_005873 [Thoreauomyces humboldtii]
MGRSRNRPLPTSRLAFFLTLTSEKLFPQKGRRPPDLWRQVVMQNFVTFVRTIFYDEMDRAWNDDDSGIDIVWDDVSSSSSSEDDPGDVDKEKGTDGRPSQSQPPPLIAPACEGQGQGQGIDEDDEEGEAARSIVQEWIQKIDFFTGLGDSLSERDSSPLSSQSDHMPGAIPDSHREPSPEPIEALPTTSPPTVPPSKVPVSSTLSSPDAPPIEIPSDILALLSFDMDFEL